MVMLCVVCAWHAIIAMCPADVAPYWDYLAFVSLAVIYTLFHLIFFLWMYFVVSSVDVQRLVSSSNSIRLIDDDVL